MWDASNVVALRLLPPFALAAIYLLVAAVSKQTLGVRAYSLLGPALVCGFAPLAPVVQSYAHTFRLNEKLAQSINNLSTATALTLTALLAAAVAGSKALNTLMPVTALVGGIIAACSAVLVVNGLQNPQRRQQLQKRVRMVYTAQPSNATAAAEATTEGADSSNPVPTEPEISSPSVEAAAKLEDAPTGSDGSPSVSAFKDTFRDIEGGRGGQGPQAPQATSFIRRHNRHGLYRRVVNPIRHGNGLRAVGRGMAVKPL